MSSLIRCYWVFIFFLRTKCFNSVDLIVHAKGVFSEQKFICLFLVSPDTLFYPEISEFENVTTCRVLFGGCDADNPTGKFDSSEF